MSRYAYGSALSSEDQQYVLRAYVHRWTGDHTPNWAKERGPLNVQFASDAEWLSLTRFLVTKSGKLDRRARGCVTTPTYPNNPRMRGSTTGRTFVANRRKEGA